MLACYLQTFLWIPRIQYQTKETKTPGLLNKETYKIEAGGENQMKPRTRVTG